MIQDTNSRNKNHFLFQLKKTGYYTSSRIVNTELLTVFLLCVCAFEIISTIIEIIIIILLTAIVINYVILF